MITTSGTDSVFVIKDYPLGRLLVAAGCFVLSGPLAVLIIMRSPFPPPVKQFPLIIWVVYGVGSFVYYLFTSKIRTTTIDGSVNMVSLSTRSLLRSRFVKYRFDELAKSYGGLRINTDYRSRTRLYISNSEYKVYGIQLVLASGEDMDLTGYASFQANGCKLAVEEANRIIQGK